jgi:hypothetical protein
MGLKMNVLIQIHYISNGIKVLQHGSFPLKGKKPEQVAYDWWRQLKRKMSYSGELEMVIADGEDITELVRALEQQEWKDINDDLPF